MPVTIAPPKPIHPWPADWTLPCGCPPGWGRDVQTCDHACHDVHRIIVGGER